MHPSFPATTSPASGLGSSGATGRIYKSGTLQTTKPQSAKHKRAHFYHAFIHQLEVAVRIRAREEEQLFQIGAVSPAIQNLLIVFHQSIVDAIDGTTQHHQRGAPRTLSDAKKLKKEADQFERQIHALVQPHQKHQSALLDCLAMLIGDVRHYARQIELTHSIVPTRDQCGHVSNRPVNLAAKIEFARLVFIHQQTHGLFSFPKPRQLRAALKAANLSVSDGTVRNWKRQMVAGTFDHYVQP